MKKHAHVLWAPGTNCHHETIWALEKAGFEAATYNILSPHIKLTATDIIVLPGGFSFGDHLGSGKIMSLVLQKNFAQGLAQAREKEIPMLGICNGFQVLVRLGFISAEGGAALLPNTAGKFESRWCELLVKKTSCIWTAGLERKILRLPVAHGEGRYQTKSGTISQAPLYYAKGQLPTEEYPWNPNGSGHGIAGVCDKTGRIFGLMPHPERAIETWHGSQDGLLIFQSIMKQI